MASVTLHPLALRGLYVMAMGKAFLRFRDPRRRRQGRHQDDFYQTMWASAAQELGGTYESLGSGLGEIEIDGWRTRVLENVTVIDDPVTLAIAHNKPLTHRILKRIGLPIPRHAIFTLKNAKPGLNFLETCGRECVVKPSGGTGGGRGVTTGIRAPFQLARASAWAACYNDELLIEEQIEGDNYRLLYLDGQLIDAFVRRRPTVIGDGRSTVRQLVDAVNEQRLSHRAGISQVLLSIDLDMRRTLARQGLTLRSRPECGRLIYVKTAINENSGADNTTVMDQLCPQIVSDCSRAVETMRIRFAGIDLVTPDASIPLGESGGVVLEINGTPNLYYHYHKSDGAFPVASHVLRKLWESRGSMARRTDLRQPVGAA